MNQSVEVPSFDRAIENGEITHQSGYHKPDKYHPNVRSCGCTKTTPKGAYRDVSVDMGGFTVHFYHQSPIVVEYDTFLRLSSCGYETATTKERINRYIPSGYFVRQEDFEWYLETPEGRTRFTDGMIIQK